MRSCVSYLAAVIGVTFAASCATTPVLEEPVFYYDEYSFEPPESTPSEHLMFDGVVAIYSDVGTMGSGFAVHADDEFLYIMTAWHVVSRGTAYRINGLPAFVHAAAPAHDLALLRLSYESPPPKLHTFAEPAIGDTVWAIGYSRWTNREISLVHRGYIVSVDTANNRGYPVFAHNAGGRGGMSGGPVFNETGEVVGVTVFFIDLGVMPFAWNPTEMCAVPGPSVEVFLNLIMEADDADPLAE